MRSLVLIAENVRSVHNVGSLLRTAEGLGCQKVYLTGYTPYPIQSNDLRLPHLAKKITAQIHKTALGAENIAIYHENLPKLIEDLKKDGYIVLGLEQHANSHLLNTYRPDQKMALIIGNEVEGIQKRTLKLCDHIIEIPMFGQKESFNVVQAAAIALYHLRFN